MTLENYVLLCVAALLAGIVNAVAGGGKAGVSHMLATMKDEVDRVQGFMGCRTLDELGRDLLLFDQHRPGANATMI